MTDDGIRFDGRSLEAGPLGGAETAFAELAAALAGLGHQVGVRNNCEAPLEHRGVDWAPLRSGVPEAPDLYIANRGDRLLRLAPRAGRTVFWIHNPARYLLKWRYQWKLAMRRPVIVFSGPFHASTYPGWACADDRRIIPLGISAAFRGGPTRASAPAPRAVFTSNPLRSLDWLLELWSKRIRPAVPGAELHICAGAAVYRADGTSGGRRMAEVLARAEALTESGVVVRGPLAKPDLAAMLARSRVFLYGGDPGETFCYAAGESQAIGLPGVVRDVACLAERIRHGETGFVTGDDDSFVDGAVRLLADDALWLAQHRACLTHQGGLSWTQVAERFAALATP